MNRQIMNSLLAHQQKLPTTEEEEEQCDRREMEARSFIDAMTFSRYPELPPIRVKARSAQDIRNDPTRTKTARDFERIEQARIKRERKNATKSKYGTPV